ncbi:hypothetical protein RclHR1_16230001 [Rhizophagus clarus]|uniref:Uncharacterized protein n=1 Tax=Rhizophagus clarus TaxID=94130 RepID=A0A2Z6R9Z1_9GLOM|nr:hypothetical protein RclHR1_16230001 [Rhizophagus clarus]
MQKHFDKVAAEEYNVLNELTNEKYYYPDDLDFYGESIRKQIYGLCSKYNQPNTDKNWCQECSSKRFRQKFGNWTSGNEYIDNLIRDSQLKPRNTNKVLEWIPYTKLRNIKYLAKDGITQDRLQCYIFHQAV